MCNMGNFKLYSDMNNVKQANKRSKTAEYVMHCAIMEMLENVNKSDSNSQVVGNNMLLLKDGKNRGKIKAFLQLFKKILYIVHWLRLSIEIPQC